MADTALRDTGFHPIDADWTRGRAQAVAASESIARMHEGLARAITLAADPVANPACCQPEGDNANG